MTLDTVQFPPHKTSWYFHAKSVPGSLMSLFILIGKVEQQFSFAINSLTFIVSFPPGLWPVLFLFTCLLYTLRPHLSIDILYKCNRLHLYIMLYPMNGLVKPHKLRLMLLVYLCLRIRAGLTLASPGLVHKERARLASRSFSYRAYLTTM